MPDLAARCELLERENDELRARIEQLETQLGFTFDSPAFLELSGSEARLFGALMAREAITKNFAMDAIYGDRPGADAPEQKIVDVFICKMRAKLKPWGIEVGTNWGQGYFMTQATKQRVRTLIDERSAA